MSDRVPNDRNISLTPGAARKLSDALVRRRTELGLRSARALGLESGLDYRTITNLEARRRKEVSRNTLAVLEMKLQWPAGYLNSLLETADAVARMVTVELTVPEGASDSDVERAREIAQATFNATIRQISGNV